MANIGVGYNTSNSLVTGTVYADKIYNGGRANTIIAGDGNDTIESVVHAYPYRYGYNSSIVAGAGNDSIVSNGNNATIDGGTGNDYIKNYYYSSLYTFLGEGSKVSLYGGAGNDTIENEGKNATIRGGTGNDSIKNKGLSTTFQYAAGDGRDTISGFNSSSTLQVLSSGVKVKSAISDGTNITLNVGSDSIILQECTNSVVVAKYANGQRESVSVSYNVNTSSWGSTPKNIVIGNNTSRSFSRGSNGNDTILNAGKYNTIEAGTGDDSINSHVVDTFLYGTGYIYRAGYYASINAGAGNDTIRNNGYKATIDAGSGNDYVYNYCGPDSAYMFRDLCTGNKTLIRGGSGNDTIYNGSAYVTINGGAGNDIVSLSSYNNYNVIQYANGDGNDKIYNIGSTDTLTITSGSYSSMPSGSDIILTVGSGKITLVGARYKSLNIRGTKVNPTPTPTPTISGGKNISNSTSSKTVNGTSYADKIYNYYGGKYSTINAGAGNDTISNTGDTVKVYGGAGNDSIYSYSYYSTISGGTGNDTVSLNSYGHNNVIQYASGDGNDVVYNLGSTDTLSITGGSYTRSTVGSDVVFKVGSGAVTVKGGKGKSFNVKGTQATTSGGGSTSTTSSSKRTYLSINSSNVTITAKSYADTLYNYGSYVKMDGGSGNDQLTSFSNGSRVTLTGGSGNDTIKSWSAYSRIDGGDGADYLYAGANYSTILGSSGNDSIINYGSYNSILGEAGSDTIENTSIGNYSTLNGGEGNDILKAGGASKDTLIGGKGNDSLWGGSGADTFIYSNGDGNDVIYGFANNDLLQITGAFSASYSKSKGEVYFNVGSSKITLKNYTTTAFHVNNKTYTLK